MNSLWHILADHIKERKLLCSMAINDVKARFATSALGVLWAFVTPLTTMLVFWFVFQVGLKNGDVNGHPFIVWYAPAFLIWTFFADTWSSTTNSVREYSYLVRKINFRVSIIPTIKIFSGTIIHVAFILFIIILNMCYGIMPNLYYLQVFYYFLCTFVLLFGLGLLCSSITPFLGDIPSIVGVITQVGFWATPIVWNPDIMSGWVQRVLQINPLYYICTGYRDTFIDRVWFWQHGSQTIAFWVTTLIVLLLGCYTFNKLSEQFADVL